MKKRVLFFIFVLSFCTTHAQIAIGTDRPHASAALDITSYNKGLLIPRVALLSLYDRVTIPDPAHSMLVFTMQDIGDFLGPGYYWWNKQTGIWKRLIDMDASAGSDWGLAGNAGTNPGLQFIGTTDDVDLVFKRNRLPAGLLNASNSNTSFGVNSYAGSSTTGVFNTAIGFKSLYGLGTTSATGKHNTALGAYALANTTNAIANVAVGASTMLNNRTGSYNVAIGNLALRANESHYNVAVGDQSQHENTQGNGNTSLGAHALYANEIGVNNTAIGYVAGPKKKNLSNTLALGYAALVTESNMVRLGNYDINRIDMQVPINITSDRRVKEQITDLDLGIDFLNMLRPVAYKRKDAEQQKKEWGLIAQELQQTLQEINCSDAGIVQEDGTPDQMLSVRYTDLIAPMIKAIQELALNSTALEQQLLLQKLRSEKLEAELSELKKWVSEHIK